MKRNYFLFLLTTLFWFISVGVFSQDNDNLGLGNPSNAITDTTYSDNFLMVKPQYTLSYNNSKHVPNWVNWHVSVSDLGAIQRKNNFRSDSTLPIGWYHVKPSDYSQSGFDKGHQCPSGDRTNDGENNSATFLMTNMIPQAPNNNRITWEHLESYCRKLVNAGNELYIICGISGQGGTGSVGFAKTVKDDVVVPAQVWKIVVVLKDGDNDISRIDKSTRVISVLIPNDQSCSEKDWGDYRVSVDQLQLLTGYDFLLSVPKEIQIEIESKVDTEEIN